jgi:hypothetical protein
MTSNPSETPSTDQPEHGPVDNKEPSADSRRAPIANLEASAPDLPSEPQQNSNMEAQVDKPAVIAQPAVKPGSSATSPRGKSNRPKKDAPKPGPAALERSTPKNAPTTSPSKGIKTGESCQPSQEGVLQSPPTIPPTQMSDMTVAPVLRAVFGEAPIDGAAFAGFLTAVSACAGHAVEIEADTRNVPAVLRTAIIGDQAGLLPIIAPLMDAVYRVQNAEIDAWHLRRDTGNLAIEQATKKLRIQLATAAHFLQAPAPESASLSRTSATSKHPPNFICRNSTWSKVLKAAGTKGHLLVDDRKMPTVAGWGYNYDTDTAASLSASSRGEPFEVTTTTGHTTVRPVPVSVIGPMKPEDAYWMYRPECAHLAATLFVYAETPFTLETEFCHTILQRARSLGAEGSVHRVHLSSKASKIFQKFSVASDMVLPPLKDFLAGVPDLSLRTALAIHIARWAAGLDAELPPEISEETMRQATSFIRDVAIPHGQQFLGLASVPPVIIVARRIVSITQQTVSAGDAGEFFRRAAVTALQNAHFITDIDEALRLLEDLGLLVPVAIDRTAPKGGPRYKVARQIFEPNHQLPDLVTDPRAA